MKNTNPNGPKEDSRNRGAEKRPGKMNIPGDEGARERMPADPNDIIHEDDLLQSDMADEGAHEVESALDEAKARGELREMPGMTEVIKRERESEVEREKEP